MGAALRSGSNRRVSWLRSLNYIGPLGILTAPMIIRILIGCLTAALLFCIACCRPKPDGGFYWTFVTYAPVIAGGDGSSYKTAYQLKKGQAGRLATVEIETIRDRYWVTSQRSYEDFYHKCYDTLVFTNVSLNDRAYDLITFTLPEGTNTVYFDVTDYRQKK